MSRGATDVSFKTFEALHLVDTHLDVTQFGVVYVAISKITLTSSVVPVEERA